MDWVNIIVLLDGVGVDTFYYGGQVNLCVWPGDCGLTSSKAAASHVMGWRGRVAWLVFEDSYSPVYMGNCRLGQCLPPRFDGLRRTVDSEILALSVCPA